MRPSLLAAGLLAGVGCVHYEPVGPLAKQMSGSLAGSRPSNGVRVSPVKDATAMPILPPAPPPMPPTMMVTPADVSEETIQQAAMRLTEEMDADRRAMEQMPRYAEVSVVKAPR